MKDIVRAGIRSVGQVREIAEAVTKLFELERVEGDIPVRLGSALRQLLAGRGRF